MRIEQLDGIIFLIWYGYTTGWRNAIALVVVGFVGAFILIAIEHALNLPRIAWAISLAGVVAIPFLLWFLVTQVLSIS
jgi:hypothetical protein